MVTFSDFEIDINSYYIRVSAQSLYSFKNQEDTTLYMGTPAFWDRNIAAWINKKKYSIYAIAFKEIKHGSHNKVTDYKKIWGICGIPKGIYDTYFDLAESRVYCGLTKLFEGNTLVDFHSMQYLIVRDENILFNTDFCTELYKIMMIVRSKLPVNINGRCWNLSIVLLKFSNLVDASMELIGESADEFMDFYDSTIIETDEMSGHYNP